MGCRRWPRPASVFRAFTSKCWDHKETGTSRWVLQQWAPSCHQLLAWFQAHRRALDTCQRWQAPACTCEHCPCSICRPNAAGQLLSLLSSSVGCPGLPCYQHGAGSGALQIYPAAFALQGNGKHQSSSQAVQEAGKLGWPAQLCPAYPENEPLSNQQCFMFSKVRHNFGDQQRAG